LLFINILRLAGAVSRIFMQIWVTRKPRTLFHPLSIVFSAVFFFSSLFLIDHERRLSKLLMASGREELWHWLFNWNKSLLEELVWIEWIVNWGAGGACQEIAPIGIRIQSTFTSPWEIGELGTRRYIGGH